ncbi:hypothetical protein B0A49_08159 [Cryomyces minteri]|uniref:RING-type domain-containing protein n=1 Tax=Cryomyces minteri TaxID=331657 RepID=A0A4U0X7L4_9PEZI|nr:hypothetical protein B0A49_08159 [Cryomyces minteri]
MPPQCCIMLQLRVALPYLSHIEADAYRAKFEEWSSNDKTYCPVPTCSAFIPKRTIPVEVSPPASGFTLAKTTMTPARQDYLSAKINSLLSMEEAVGSIAPRTTSRIGPNAPQTGEPPMCLSVLAQKLRRGGYTTLPDYSADFHRIVDNATETGGTTATTARTMRRRFLEALQDLPDDEAGSSRLHFPCPACAARICASCKQRAHPGTPCDTTAADHELAFLSTFGYKRCPGCGHGVRRMYGCSHMQCICGAHWCWHCAQAIEDCPGGCGSLDEAAATSGGGQEPDNLDDRPRRYWERAGMDFGGEPDEPADFWLEPVN